MTTEKPSKDGTDQCTWCEVIAVIPQSLLVVLALLALILFYPSVRGLIDRGAITKVTVFGVELALTGIPVERGNDPIDTAKQSLMSAEERTALTDRFHRMENKTLGATVLWVDDKHPYQNVLERRVLFAAKMYVDFPSSTDEGLQWLNASAPNNAPQYDVLITNLRRDSEQKKEACSTGSPEINAGCYFIQEVQRRFNGKMPPTIAYIGNVNPKLGTPAYTVGITNRPAELFHLILNILEKKQPTSARSG